MIPPLRAWNCRGWKSKHSPRSSRVDHLLGPGTPRPAHDRTADHHRDETHQHARQISRNPNDRVPDTDGEVRDSNQGQEPAKDCSGLAEAEGHFKSPHKPTFLLELKRCRLLLSKIPYNRQRIAARESADSAARIGRVEDPPLRPQYECGRLDVRLAFMLAGIAADSPGCGFRIQTVKHPESQPELLDCSPRFLFAIG
jgi:hypothetical protein